MVIETTVKSLEFDNQNQVCDFINETNTIHKVISILPNLHSNAYVLFFEEYTTKEFKVMKKKTLKAIKTRYKLKQIKKNKNK